MDIYTTEEEQVQKIKDAVRTYGPTVLLSLAIFLMGSFGWRYWHGHQEQQLMIASSNYEQVLASFMGNDKSATQSQAVQLIQKYPETPYAELAAFLLAKQAVDANQYNEALKQLQWIREHSRSIDMKQVARNRSAQILIAEKKSQAALDLLASVDDPSYKPAIDSLRGDAYVALGNQSAALLAYQQALNALPKNSADGSLLQMKLNDIK